MSNVKNVCKKYEVEPTSKEIVQLKTLLGKKMGYFSTFAKWHFEDEQTLNDLGDLYTMLTESNIDRNINSFKSTEELFDYIRDFNNKKKTKQVIKSIPSKTRKLLNDKTIELISDNIDLEKSFKDFFSRKGGTCKTADDIYQKVSEIINQNKKDYSYNKILRGIKFKLFLSKYKLSATTRFIHKYILMFPYSLVIYIYKVLTHQAIHNEKFFDKGGEIVYKDGKTIIVKIHTYSASMLLGSKRWCISYSRGYWDNYLGGDNKFNTQYFIYQTNYNRGDKRSMIGVTVRPMDGGYSAIHYKNDQRCDGSELNDYKEYLIGKTVPVESISDMVNYNVVDRDLYYQQEWYVHFLANINQVLLIKLLKNKLPINTDSTFRFYNKFIESELGLGIYKSQLLHRLCEKNVGFIFMSEMCDLDYILKETDEYLNVGGHRHIAANMCDSYVKGMLYNAYEIYFHYQYVGSYNEMYGTHRNRISTHYGRGINSFDDIDHYMQYYQNGSVDNFLPIHYNTWHNFHQGDYEHILQVKDFVERGYIYSGRDDYRIRGDVSFIINRNAYVMKTLDSVNLDIGFFGEWKNSNDDEKNSMLRNTLQEMTIILKNSINNGVRW